MSHSGEPQRRERCVRQGLTERKTGVFWWEVTCVCLWWGLPPWALVLWSERVFGSVSGAGRRENSFIQKSSALLLWVAHSFTVSFRTTHTQTHTQTQTQTHTHTHTHTHRETQRHTHTHTESSAGWCWLGRSYSSIYSLLIFFITSCLAYPDLALFFSSLHSSSLLSLFVFSFCSSPVISSLLPFNLFCFLISFFTSSLLFSLLIQRDVIALTSVYVPKSRSCSDVCVCVCEQVRYCCYCTFIFICVLHITASVNNSCRHPVCVFFCVLHLPLLLCKCVYGLKTACSPAESEYSVTVGCIEYFSRQIILTEDGRETQNTHAHTHTHWSGGEACVTCLRAVRDSLELELLYIQLLPGW